MEPGDEGGANADQIPLRGSKSVATCMASAPYVFGFVLLFAFLLLLVS